MCDNPQCDWSDYTIKNSEMEQYINTACPKCGENILTQSDHDQFQQFIKSMAAMPEPEQSADEQMWGGKMHLHNGKLQLFNDDNSEPTELIFYLTHDLLLEYGFEFGTFGLPKKMEKGIAAYNKDYEVPYTGTKMKFGLIPLGDNIHWGLMLYDVETKRALLASCISKFSQLRASWLGITFTELEKTLSNNSPVKTE